MLEFFGHFLSLRKSKMSKKQGADFEYSRLVLQKNLMSHVLQSVSVTICLYTARNFSRSKNQAIELRKELNFFKKHIA